MKVELLGGLKVIREANLNQQCVIKDELSLDNPVYENIKRYSRFESTSVPQYLYFYSKLGEALLVPRGYKIPFKVDNNINSSVSKKVEYPKLRIKLRETQREAFNKWKENPYNGVTVLPTGKGKSIYGAYLAYSTRQKTLIVVQKIDLVDGWKKDLKIMFGLRPKQIGLIKSKIFRLGSQFTITTIQTLSRLNPMELKKLYSEFGMIIVDEFHHSPAESYNILRYFKSRYYVGLTATDMREDGLQKVLYWMFGDVCYRCEEREDDEDIMPYSVKILNSSVKGEVKQEFYKNGKRKPINYSALQKLIIHSSSFNERVASDIMREYGLGKSCVAFFHEKEHIHIMRELLEQRGANKDQIQIYCGDSKDSDSVLKERAESKEVLITLATYAKATEGTNVKSWERGFLVSSLNNVKGVIQAVGRCRRRKTDKKDVVIYDYRHPKVMCICNHGKTRDRAYKTTKANVIGKEKSPILKRGWTKF